MDTELTEKRKSPSLALFETNDRLHKKLDELETMMIGMRNVLFGAQPTDEEVKASESPSKTGS